MRQSPEIPTSTRKVLQELPTRTSKGHGDHETTSYQIQRYLSKSSDINRNTICSKICSQNWHCTSIQQQIKRNEDPKGPTRTSIYPRGLIRTSEGWTLSGFLHQLMRQSPEFPTSTKKVLPRYQPEPVCVMVITIGTSYQVQLYFSKSECWPAYSTLGCDNREKRGCISHELAHDGRTTISWSHRERCTNMWLIIPIYCFPEKKKYLWQSGVVDISAPPINF